MSPPSSSASMMFHRMKASFPLNGGKEESSSHCNDVKFSALPSVISRLSNTNKSWKTDETLDFSMTSNQYKNCDSLVKSTISLADEKKNDSTATILACSPIRSRNYLPVKRSQLSDKKKPFEHLKPRSFIFCTIRIVILQGGQVMTTYLTDQIEYEMANEELIVQGEITAIEADERNEKWEENEWANRWKQFPRRAVTAFIRLQSATLIMRAYEYLASKMVTSRTLDKLTKDPFKSAKRKSDRYADNNDNNALMMVIGKKMFHT